MNFEPRIWTADEVIKPDDMTPFYFVANSDYEELKMAYEQLVMIVTAIPETTNSKDR